MDILKIKLVVFDLDGVLVDACEWHRVALNKALKEISGYEISLEDHHKEFNGIPTKVKLNKLVEKKIVQQQDIEKIEQLKQIKTIELINSQAFIRHEKIELISFLKQKQIKVACYTNSIRVTAELMLKKTGILELFDLLITNQDVTVPKPNPEGYIKCMDHFKIDSRNCLIVEDSPKGIEAARNSGAEVLVVYNQNDVTKDTFLTEVKLYEDSYSNGGRRK